MKKKQLGLSISLKLIIYISVVILLICSFVTVFASIISRNILKNEATQTLTEIAKQAADTVSAKVDSSFNSLKILQKNSMFQYPEEYKNEIIKLLSEQVDKDGCIEMTVIDKNGKSFSVKDKERDHSDKEYFQKAIKGQKFVTDPFYKTAGDPEMIIIYAYPLINDQNEITGVLTTTKKATELSDMIKDVHYKTGSTFIISSSYATIAHSQQDKVLESNQDTNTVSAEIKKLIEEQNGVGSYEVNGVTKYIAYAKVEGTSWYLAIDVPEVDVTGQVSSLTSGLIYIGIAGLVLGMFISVFIARNIKKPIRKLVEVSEYYARGKFDIDINLRRKDEFGKLAGKLQEVCDNMNILISNIRSASKQVASGAKQISDSSMILSQGAAEQASSLEELSSTVEEISSQTKLNAEYAENANRISSEAQKKAEFGNNQMNLMLGAMEDINTSSANISKIIKVIDDIAFQTNILALNAAIEAARAGQAGKGFAVVAEEVRNLAAKSAAAAQETSDLIEGSIGKVHDGVKIAKDTADYLNNIVKDVSRVAELVSNITVASNEQASGIAQVNQGIIEVSRVVQENSSTSEESAAASQQLSGQAALLDEQIAKFRLKDHIDKERIMQNSLSDGNDDFEIKENLFKNKFADLKNKLIGYSKKKSKPAKKYTGKKKTAATSGNEPDNTEDNFVEENIIEDTVAGDIAEDMIEDKNEQAVQEGKTTKSEPKEKSSDEDVALSDSEFGKY